MSKAEFSTRQCGDVSDHFYETDTRSPRRALCAPEETSCFSVERISNIPQRQEAVSDTESSTRECGDVSDHFYETDTRSPPARFARRRKRELLLCRKDLNHLHTAVWRIQCLTQPLPLRVPYLFRVPYRVQSNGQSAIGGIRQPTR